VLLATVAFFPLLFLLALAMPEREDVPLTDGIAITLLGTLWVGLAIAHAILLRELPHGGGLVLAILLGTFIGDTAAISAGARSAAGRSRCASRPTRRSKGSRAASWARRSRSGGTA
jgi:phosphatidate cytidylyltransferase